MWNTPSPAPEYRLGWGYKALVRQCMMRILEWDFERVILSHGDLITRDAKRLIAHAWRKILGRAIPLDRWLPPPVNCRAQVSCKSVKPPPHLRMR